jgi:nucleoside-diphosphate-sugar epimerase
MQKILITGGGGYIGNILSPQLLQAGFQVTVLDNLIHRQHGILENTSYRNFNFVYGDVRNFELYEKLIVQNDIIVNLAAYVGMPLCNRFPIETKQVNQDSAEFLASKVSKDQLVIHANTNSGYGLGQHTGGKAVFCTEETPLNPISIYGKTKCAAEKAIMASGNNITFRLATVMGVSRKMRMDLLVNDFTWRAWNDRFIVLFESQTYNNNLLYKRQT